MGATGEGEATEEMTRTRRRKGSPEFIVTIGEHRQLVVAYSRSMRKKDEICRFIESIRGVDRRADEGLFLSSLTNIRTCRLPWGDRRGRLNGHLVLLPLPLPETKRP